MRLLPFNFDRLSDDKVVISNLAGFHKCISSDTLSLLINNHDDLKRGIVNELQSGFFLSEEGSFETAGAVIASGLAKRLMAEMTFRPVFMIGPTLRCDHDCSYCQVSRASLKSVGYDLDKALIPKIVGTIKNLSDAPYKIEIQGGEPLVRFDIVKSIFSEAESQLGVDNIEIIITSSLSLIDEDILGWAKDKPITFSASMDGDSLIHDSNRILPNNSSYEKFSRSVALIQKLLGKDCVSTVTTVTSELMKRPKALIDSVVQLGLHDIFVRPISPYGFAPSSASNYSMSDYIDFYSELLYLILEVNKSGYSLTEHSASIHLKRVFNPGFSHYADLKSPSGFLFNSVLFNYDGRVFGSDEARMLQRVSSTVDFSFGHVNNIDFSSNNIVKNIIANSFNMVQPGCESCAYQPFCGSDPMQNLSLFGEPVGLKKESIFCSYHKSMFRLIFDKYYSDSEYHALFDGWCYE